MADGLAWLDDLWIRGASIGYEHECIAGEEPSIVSGPEVLLPLGRLVGGQDASSFWKQESPAPGAGRGLPPAEEAVHGNHGD